MPITVTKEQVVSRLAEEVGAAGSLTGWARAHGTSVGYLHDVLNGRRPPGPRILGPLGYRAVTSTVYEEVT